MTIVPPQAVHLRVLRAVAAIGREGATTVRRVVVETGLDHVAVARSTDPLRQNGLVEVDGPKVPAANRW